MGVRESMRTAEIWKEILNPYRLTRGELKFVYHNNEGSQYTVIYDFHQRKWFVIEHKLILKSHRWGLNTKIPKRLKRELIAKALRKLQKERNNFSKGELSE